MNAVELNKKAVQMEAAGEFDNAIKLYKEAIRLEPGISDLRSNLGISLLQTGALTDALSAFNKALELNKDNSNAVSGKLHVLQRQDRYEEAYDTAKPFLKRSACPMSIATTFAEFCKYVDKTEETIDLLENLISNPSITQRDEMTGGYALARLYDKKGLYDPAFKYAKRANAIRGNMYSPEAAEKEFKILKETFTREFISLLPKASISTETPVFVFGMPRSGTSLIERILASHPRVIGAGELKHMANIVFSMKDILHSEKPYPVCMKDATPEILDKIVEYYLDNLMKNQTPGVLSIVDKTVENFKHLGLLQILFPKVKFIHSVRHPLDTCLSCYFQTFLGTEVPYSSSLKHLAHYYRQYKSLMKHWGNELDIDILDVVYEELVENTEAVSRRIVDFCGLEWDDSCLNFYESNQITTTASYDQVRQPIYKKSVHRYKNYEKYLGELSGLCREQSTKTGKRSSEPVRFASTEQEGSAPPVHDR